MITNKQIYYPNIFINEISLERSNSDNDSYIFEIYPRIKPTWGDEKDSTFVFKSLTITEDMFAEGIVGTLTFGDSTYITDQLKLSLYSNIYFKMHDDTNNNVDSNYITGKYRIIDVNVTTDLADKNIHGPAGSINTIVIRFSSDELVYRNMDSPEKIFNWIGKISLDSKDSINNNIQHTFPEERTYLRGVCSSKIPYFDSLELSKCEELLKIQISDEYGFVQFIMNNTNQTFWTKKKLIADSTYNDIWFKPISFLYPYFKKDRSIQVSQLLNYICEYACYKKNPKAVNFFFWEDLSQWNFRCIESLLSDADNFKGWYAPRMDEFYADGYSSLEVISDISPLKLLTSGAAYSQYTRVVPYWSNPYRNFTTTEDSMLKEEITYNYHDDFYKNETKQIKTISFYPIFSKYEYTNFRKQNSFSRIELVDNNYGFYGKQYNNEQIVSDFEYYDWSRNLSFGERMMLPKPYGRDIMAEAKNKFPSPTSIQYLKYAVSDAFGGAIDQTARSDKEYWQSQFDFSELPGAFLNQIHGWDGTKTYNVNPRMNYSDLKIKQKKWDVYKNTICCQRTPPESFFALVYRADKIYGGDGISYAFDPGGIYAYSWKEVELWPRNEVAQILNPGYEVIEFEKTDNTENPAPFPFMFITSPSMLQGYGLTAISSKPGLTYPEKFDTRAYNLNEILNSVAPKYAEDGGSAETTLLMNPGVSTTLTSNQDDRKSKTSYPNKYQMMPVGKFRIISTTCPDFTLDGVGVNTNENEAGMYYGGRIVQMFTIPANTMQNIVGFTASNTVVKDSNPQTNLRYPLKPQRPYIFMFDVENTHDGLCTGGCP